MTETDPGSTGKKLSKSDDNKLELRNKSYEKVIDLQFAWIRAHRARDRSIPDDPQPEYLQELMDKWLNKSKWHEKEHGW